MHFPRILEAMDLTEMMKLSDHCGSHAKTFVHFPRILEAMDAPNFDGKDKT